MNTIFEKKISLKITDEFKYEGENKKTYLISINSTSENEISLSFIGKNETNEIYTSKYLIDDLNEKFGKIKQFKKIKDFRNILVDNNINKKELILKPSYNNVITSIWKTFPKENSKTETFTLISSKSNNKNISLIFFSNYTQSEPIVKELENQFVIKQKNKVNEKTYSFIQFEENWILDKMYFLVGIYDDEDKKVNDYLKIIETNKEILE